MKVHCCMHRPMLAFLLLPLFNFAHSKAGSKAKDAVKPESIKALTFHSGKLTTARRVDPIPQLQCVGGSAKGLYEPETIRCHNSGSSYSEGDVEWTCQASLPPEFRLGSTEVVCEGYDNADDKFILKGSCGLEYRLVLTETGKEKFGKSWFATTDRASAPRGGNDFSPYIFWAVFFIVVCWMIYAAFWRRDNQDRGNRGNRLGFGPRGGGPDGDDDPPPPYDPRPPPSTFPRSQKPNPSSSTYYGYRNQPQNTQGGGWRPGFWSGLGTGLTAGAAARHLFGGDRTDSGERPRRSGGAFGGGPAFDSGEGSSTGRRRAGPSYGSTAGTGMGPSSQPYSSERYTSTGFGGTRRR